LIFIVSSNLIPNGFANAMPSADLLFSLHKKVLEISSKLLFQALLMPS